MPILILILLVGTCVEVAWPNPLGLSAHATLRLTGSLVFVALLASSTLSYAVVRMLQRDATQRMAVAQLYGRCRRLLFFVNLGFTIAALLGLGWGQMIWQNLTIEYDGQELLFPYAEILVSSPYLVLMICNWAIYFPAERALHRANIGNSSPFWSLPGYFVFQARTFTLMILFPVFLVVSQQTLIRFVPSVVGAWWFHLIGVLGVLLLFIVLPRFVKPALGLKRLPTGAFRERMVALAARMRVRLTDLLLWPTQGSLVNAMIVGVVPSARYVIFTDRILDELNSEEIDAVFGHELGHAKHGHLPFYACFFLLSSVAVFSTAAMILKQLDAHARLPTELWSEFLPLPPLMAMALYIFIVFGYLSRVCERQADVAGCRAVSCMNPNCTQHLEADVQMSDGIAVCPTGVLAMIHALERVVASRDDDVEKTGWRKRTANIWAWMRAWQHGPARSRIEFLYSLRDAPALASRHDRFAFRIRLGMVIGLIAVVVLNGSIMGWSELVRRL